MVNFRQVVRSTTLGCWLSVILFVSAAVAFAPLASGQDFTLTSSGFTPRAVDPGVPATATINVQPLNTTTAPTVNLSCTVAPVETNGPVCSIPSSVTAPAIPAVTVSTNGAPETTYNVTITGTDASGSQTLPLSLTVVAVAPGYTLTVTDPLNPTSLHAGAGTSGELTLTSVNGYSGQVTLSCSTVTPAVIPSPQCEFTSNTGATGPISVNSSAPSRAILTITTAGPNTFLRLPRSVYALWLFVPGLMLAGARSAKNRRKKLRLMGWLVLMTFAFTLFLPACGSQTNNPAPSVTPLGSGTTPNNTYTFTITGADANGLTPSNTAPTVTLTVD